MSRVYVTNFAKLLGKIVISYKKNANPTALESKATVLYDGYIYRV